MCGKIFDWVGWIGCRLARSPAAEAEGTQSPKGKAWWDRTSVWGTLKNPAYMGHAAFGKTRTANDGRGRGRHVGRARPRVVLELRHERS